MNSASPCRGRLVALTSLPLFFLLIYLWKLQAQFSEPSIVSLLLKCEETQIVEVASSYFLNFLYFYSKLWKMKNFSVQCERENTIKIHHARGFVAVCKPLYSVPHLLVKFVRTRSPYKSTSYPLLVLL